MKYYGSLIGLAPLCMIRGGNILGDDDGVKMRQGAVEARGWNTCSWRSMRLADAKGLCITGVDEADKAWNALHSCMSHSHILYLSSTTSLSLVAALPNPNPIFKNLVTSRYTIHLPLPKSSSLSRYLLGLQYHPYPQSL